MIATQYPMASRRIAPAPAPVGNNKATTPNALVAGRPRLNSDVPRGKQDISISTAGLLNPEVIGNIENDNVNVQNATVAKPIAKARAVPAASSKKPKPPQAEFGFVNISNPSQSSSRQHKSFVKSFVRQQTVKQDRDAKSSTAGRAPENPKASASFNREFIGGAGSEIRPSYLLESTPRKTSKVTARQKKRTQILLNASGASPEDILEMYHRGGVEIAAGWEVFRTWSSRYPKATYDELIRLIGVDLYRIEQNPYDSTIMYPIELDTDGQDLVKFLHCGIDVTQLRLAFRPVWFSLFLKDSAAFLQMMSAAMTHRGYTHGLVNETKAMFLRQQAWMSVNDRLADPAHCTSDGTLAAILSFLILDYSMKNLDQYLIAKAGLVKLVNMRGGISALEHNSELRLVLLWDDVGSSTAFDIPPRFGLPLYHLPPLPHKSPIRPSPRLLKVITTWSTISPKMTTLLHDLFILNSLIVLQLPRLYDDPLFLGLQINPVVMRLLMKATAPDSAWIEMVCATAALVYMGEVRTKFCTYHLTGYHFVRRLRKLIDGRLGGDGEDGSVDEWREFADWKLWVLVIGGMKALDIAGDREFFIKGIRDAMRERGMVRWGEVREVVESLVWIEAIHGDNGRALERDVMRGNGRKEGSYEEKVGV